MRFAKINEAIWADQKFRTVSDGSKLMYIYLLSCPKCNSIGVFQIGLGQMEDEFGVGRDVIKARITELSDEALVRYRDGWMWFSKFLRWNDPTSPNHARRLAIDVNECVMRGAPVEAVSNFLRSAKSVLKSLTYKAKDKEKSYYDEFLSALDINLISRYVGGTEALKKCLDSDRCGIEKEEPKKDLGSTDKALPTRAHNTNTNTITNTTQTEAQQNDCASSKCNKTEVSLFSADGSPIAIGQESVLLMRSRFLPEDEDGWQKAIISAQRESLSAHIRISDADSWFTQYMTTHFKGAT